MSMNTAAPHSPEASALVPVNSENDSTSHRLLEEVSKMINSPGFKQNNAANNGDQSGVTNTLHNLGFGHCTLTDDSKSSSSRVDQAKACDRFSAEPSDPLWKPPALHITHDRPGSIQLAPGMDVHKDSSGIENPFRSHGAGGDNAGRGQQMQQAHSSERQTDNAAQNTQQGHTALEELRKSTRKMTPNFQGDLRKPMEAATCETANDSRLSELKKLFHFNN